MKKARFFSSFVLIGAIACVLVTLKNFQLLNKVHKRVFQVVKHDTNPYIIHDANDSFSAIKVLVNGTLLQRIQAFNDGLDKLRSHALSNGTSGDWLPPKTQDKIQLMWTLRDDFLLLLGNFSQMQMVMLPWDTTEGSGKNWSSLKDEHNLLIQNYYQWTADDPLCNWIETPGTIRMKYDVTYNRTCYRNMSQSIKPQSMNTLVLNAKPIGKAHYWPNEGNSFPGYFYVQQPPFVFYMYIIHDAIVTDTSDVYSGNLKLVQFACSYNIDTKPPSDVNRIPLLNEIFPIAQYWGTAIFHRMVEIIPKVSLYLEFLKRNPSIMILAPETKGRTAELLKILGINETRLISGTFRAKVVYLPRSTMCGFANVQETQVASMLYRNYITSNFALETRNKLILIRRSGSRRFTKQLEIERVLKEIAKAFNLKYVLFIDNPVPSLNETMRIFYSAVMVVAPHGAGLANVMFSQPGTYVVEGVCNLPHVNFCFQRLSYVLGHHWHGTPSRGGCEGVVDVDPESIKKAALSYLNQRKSTIY